MAIPRPDAGARTRDRAPRTLVIFDVDGTLTRTNDVDTKCFVRRSARARLRRAPCWAAALATGSWQPPALVKLAGARLDVGALPIASADDGIARERIVRIARMRAERAYGGVFTRVVLVGDAPWDARTASRLRLPMVGVAAKGAEARLRAHGVTRVLHDFRDVAAVLHAWRTADVPRAIAGERT